MRVERSKKLSETCFKRVAEGTGISGAGLASQKTSLGCLCTSLEYIYSHRVSKSSQLLYFVLAQVKVDTKYFLPGYITWHIVINMSKFLHAKLLHDKTIICTKFSMPATLHMLFGS